MIKVLYRDKFIIAVNKPSGMLSESSPTEECSVLSEVARAENIPLPLPVHRLDRNVSGLMLLARNSSAAGKFSALVSERSMNKEYLAIVHGRPSEECGIYKDLLFKDSSCNKSFVVDKIRKGVKEASLEYRTIAERDSEDGILSLVRIRLHTGRTHQIRVQFSSRHTPLFGDGKYGSHTNRGEIALCSARMSFIHPFSKKSIDIRNLPAQDTYPWNLFADLFKTEMFDLTILDNQ
jgi:23S rRNA pseudouridine1911/1915/1917 synthase